MRSAALTVGASSGSSTKSTTLVLRGTPDTPFPGRWLTTDGLPKSTAGVVVNWLRKFARRLPARSVTAFVTTTVTTLDGGKVVLSVTVRPSADRLTSAPSCWPAANSANVASLTVPAFNGSVNVTTTGAFGPISVAPSPGVTNN